MATSQLTIPIDILTSLPLDSPAKILVSPEVKLDWTAIVQDSSSRSSESFAQSDPVTCYWKTSQPCLLSTRGELWAQYSQSFPRSGTMRSGKLFPLLPLVPITSAKECGLLPTPTASDDRSLTSLTVGTYANGGFYIQTRKGKSCARVTNVLNYLKRPDLAQSPSFRELMMGFPIGWTGGIPRSARVKALGNAIVPQVVAIGLQRILDMEFSRKQ